MKKEELFNIIGEVDEQKVASAGMAMSKKKSRPAWVKWGAMAACLCLVVVGALTIPNLQNEPSRGQGTMEQVYTLPQAETMSVELVEWSVDHFKGIVVDAGDNSIFPADAELSVVFDYDTEILLDNGTIMVFNPDEPNTDAIGWKEGTIVTVKFVNYEEYREGNRFYNCAYASYVEVKNFEDSGDSNMPVRGGSTNDYGTQPDNESTQPAITDTGMGEPVRGGATNSDEIQQNNEIESTQPAQTGD